MPVQVTVSHMLPYLGLAEVRFPLLPLVQLSIYSSAL